MTVRFAGRYIRVLIIFAKINKIMDSSFMGCPLYMKVLFYLTNSKLLYMHYLMLKVFTL